MIRMVRPTTSSTRNASISSTINPAVIKPPWLVYRAKGTRPAARPSLRHERRGALDLHHVHARARFEDIVLVVRPRCPDLTADLHLAAVAVHPLEHERLRSHQRRGPRAEPRRGTHMTPRD